MESVKSAALPRSILQLKVRLLGISPMIWRRVLVPASMTLRELHGVQLAMGWEGIHLFEFVVRGARYAGPYLCGEPVDRALSSFRFRRNARFRYVYDMSCWWEHELRVEERLAAHAGKRYPRCIGGAGACPPEDCGGPDAYHTRRDEATGLDAMDDLALVADTVKRVLIGKDSSCLDDDDTRATLRILRPSSRAPSDRPGRKPARPGLVPATRTSRARSRLRGGVPTSRVGVRSRGTRDSHASDPRVPLDSGVFPGLAAFARPRARLSLIAEL